MINREVEVKLRGTALAKVKMQSKNEKNEIVYSTNKIAVINIESEAIKHCEYDSYEVYTIDNSFYDYSDDDIRIVDGYEFVLIDEFELSQLRKLMQDKDIQKYVNKKMGQESGHYPMEATEIIELIKYDLEEV